MTDHAALAGEIKDRLKRFLGFPEGVVPLHEPEFLGEEEALVTDCIRSGWVSSVGQYVDRFEGEIAKACGARYGVAVVNGTAALEVALRTIGVAKGDEVLMPSLTFIATANAASHLGAVPHFVDIEEQTLGICPIALRRHIEEIGKLANGHLYNRHTNRRITAIVAMHVFGHPVNMNGVNAVAEDFGLQVIEDAAEALGSFYDGRACGSLSSIGALSFNGNKILTTGGGGAIVTNDERLARFAKHLTTTAKQPHPWAFMHDHIGYNYRMPNLNAALGVAQLAQLEARLEKKRRLAQAYIEAFSGHPDLKVFVEPKGAKSNYWLNTFVLAPHVSAARDVVLKILNDADLMARPVWEPMHTLPVYADAPRSALPITEDLAARIINVPSSAHLAGTLI
ncbi:MULTISPECIES: LegC family aminotransferase [Kordiimonas]|jgi:perosamine synthetase|uniref:LegC family aminotransferase n=1 Tax=Kordiimonas TaxID=288021 RepID=UPI0025804D44|nr:LegC family aminotransferase [Kordiimonas sp. UBA4487]